MASNREWTTKEIAILRQIHQSRIPLVEQMHLLPGRTSAAAGQTMRAQKWGSKPPGKSSVKRPYKKRKPRERTTLKRFLQVVAEFGPITAEEISRKMNLGRSSTHGVCKFAHRGSPEKLIYVAGHTEAGVDTKYTQRKWAIGNLPDAESNSLTTRQRRRLAKEEAELEFERMKERDFAPRRDPLVSAFFGSPA